MFWPSTISALVCAQAGAEVGRREPRGKRERRQQKDRKISKSEMDPSRRSMAPHPSPLLNFPIFLVTARAARSPEQATEIRCPAYFLLFARSAKSSDKSIPNASAMLRRVANDGFVRPASIRRTCAGSTPYRSEAFSTVHRRA
jgi:hypothetical protein